MTLRCPSCATDSPAGTKFCPECGARLDAGRPGSQEVRRTVTVLFSDVTGSTALGERLDPESLRSIMNRYFGAMKVVIERHGGTVEKYIGDAIMAVFGLPTVHEDDALRAVRAASEMGFALTALNAELAHDRGMTITTRTGITTGEVVAGDAAHGTLITGDTVNTAARLEQAAPPGQILLGRPTWQLVRDAVEVEPLEPMAAKGKAAPLAAFRLISIDPGADAHTRRLDGPMVGRARELGRLEQAFRQTVADRSCQLFTLLGSAGVGKSRLTGEFITGVGVEATVLKGRCLPYGEGITYWPLGEVVRAASGIDERDAPEVAVARLAGLLEGEQDEEVLTRRVAVAIGLELAAATQEEIFWATRRLFERLARTRPLVVVFEDIHWAEATFLDLIEHVADLSRDAPLLLLCPARPELLDRRPTWGGGKLNATTILLEPLPAEATRELIDQLPGGEALPSALRSRILDAAEGNPLYLEEMLAMLVDDGLVNQTDGAWVGAAEVAEVRVPPTIQALLAARLDQLDPEERAVAERASVVGRVFEQAAVIELASVALRPEVARSLVALVRKELVRPDRSELSVGDAFKFRHILIRDAAYEALPKSDRAELHERFANWLERTASERIREYEEILGYHLAQAHRYRTELGESGERVERLAELAAGRLAAAGVRAFDRGDMSGAPGLLAAATDLYPRGSTRRLELAADRSFALFSAGRVRDAQATLAEAISEADSFGLLAFATRSRLDASLLQIISAGEYRQVSETAKLAIPILEKDGDDSGLGKAWLVLANAAWQAGQAEAAIAARSRADEYARRAGDRRSDRWTTFWGAECYGPAPAAATIRALEKMHAAAQGDPLRQSKPLFSLAGLYAMRGRVADSRRAYRDLRRIFVDLGMSVLVAAAAEIAGVAELVGEDARAAQAALEEGILGMEDLGAAAYLSTLLGIKAIALARLGENQGALDAADRAVREGSNEDVLLHVFSNTARSIAFLAMTDARSSIEAGREAIRWAESTDFVSFHADARLALGAALRAERAETEAAQSASRALQLYAAKGNLIGARAARVFIERADER